MKNRAKIIQFWIYDLRFWIYDFGFTILDFLIFTHQYFDYLCIINYNDMRKLMLILAAALCLSMTAVADQLEFVSEEDAQEAVKLLKKQKYVLLYCGCCAEGYDAKEIGRAHV